MMKDSNFELELPDGTIVQIGMLPSSRFPDVKAFHLPRAAMSPFTVQNPPRAIRDVKRDLRQASKNVF